MKFIKKKIVVDIASYLKKNINFTTCSSFNYFCISCKIAKYLVVTIDTVDCDIKVLVSYLMSDFSRIIIIIIFFFCRNKHFERNAIFVAMTLIHKNQRFINKISDHSMESLTMV